MQSFTRKTAHNFMHPEFNTSNEPSVASTGAVPFSLGRFLQYGTSQATTLRLALRAGIVLTASALAFDPGNATADEAADMERLFTLRVKPMLTEKCLGCHGDLAREVKGDFLVTSREELLLGGESFDDVLIPGDADYSFIMEAVRWEDPDYEMPPKENDRLSEQQIVDLETWINAGAPWPNYEIQEAIRVAEREVQVNDEGMLFKTSGGLIDEWTYRRYQPEDMWAFLPVEKPEVLDLDKVSYDPRWLGQSRKAASTDPRS